MQAWDTRVLYWMNGHHYPFVDHVLYPVSYAGEMGGLLIVLFYAVLVSGIPREKRLAWLPYGIIILLVNRIIFEALTLAWFRERPYLALDGVRQMGVTWYTSSFPSGHAFYACLVTVVLGVNKPATLWFFVPFTLITFYARPYLGMHYPSDVLTGAAIGIAFGFDILWAQRAWLRWKAPQPIAPEALPSDASARKARK